MKQIFTLLILSFICAATVQAQHHQLTAAQKLKSNKGQSVAANKATATFSRPGHSMNYNWDVNTSAWIHQNNSDYTYNSNGDKLTQSYMTLPPNVMVSDLDSITYNAQGQIVMHLHLYNNGSGLQPSHRVLNYYDAQGNISESLNQNYNTVLQTWENQYRNVSTYDVHGNETYYTSESWTNNAWVISYGYRTTYTYVGTTAARTEAVYEEYDQSNGWENTYRETYVNNAQGEYTSFTGYDWNGVTSAWEAEDRYINIVWHNFLNFEPLSGIGQLWDGTTWVDYERFTYSYSGSNSVGVEEEWLNNAWVLDNRYTATLDANGTSVNLEEDYNGTSWDSLYRYTEVYDQYSIYLGNRNEEYLNNAWSTNYDNTAVHTYDANGNLTERITRQWNGAGVLEPQQRFVYSNFQTFVTGNKADAVVGQVSVYPNPAQDMVTIALSDVKTGGTLQIYSTTGQQVLNQGVNELQTEMNLNSLQSGLYIIRYVAQDGATVTKKLVKE